jgi:hypothetical protein
MESLLTKLGKSYKGCFGAMILTLVFVGKPYKMQFGHFVLDSHDRS